jgi:hypothetical protein
MLKWKRILAFEVLIAVVMKNPVFPDITSCSPLKINYVLEEHTASIFRVTEYAEE